MFLHFIENNQIVRGLIYFEVLTLPSPAGRTLQNHRHYSKEDRSQKINHPFKNLEIANCQIIDIADI